MRVMICCCMILAEGYISNLGAAESSKRSQGISVYVESLRKSAPEVAAAFNEEFTGHFNRKDIDDILWIVRQMRMRVGKDNDDTEKKMSLEDGHRAAWNIALHSFGKTNESEAKQRIMREWDASLAKKGSHVVSQICSLADEWQEDMLTDKFWSLVANDADLNVIKSVCFVLYTNGSGEHRKRLKELLGEELESPEARQIVQNALNWMKFDATQNSDWPGPASAPPHMLYSAKGNGSTITKKEKKAEEYENPQEQKTEDRKQKGEQDSLWQPVEK